MKLLGASDLELISGDESKNLYFYGISHIASYALISLQRMGIKISGIFDSNKPDTCGNIFDPNELMTSKVVLDNINVLGQDKIATCSKDSIFIITCSHYIEISRYLHDLGYVNVFDSTYLIGLSLKSSKLSSVDEVKCTRFYHALNEKAKRAIGEVSSSALVIPSIDVIVTERCTLKCADCANLMPYFQKPIDIGFQLLYDGVNTLSKLSNEILELRILGGEPLLYKEIDKVISFCTNIPNCKKIVVYTNATLVPNKETLEALAHEKVFVEITNYLSKSRKLDKMTSSFNTNNIIYTIKELPTTWDDSANIINEERNNSELRSMYDSCCAKYLFTLMHGKLYRCPFSASLNALNLKINTEGDALDVRDSKLLTRELLYDFIYQKNYIPSCKYCQGRSKLFSRVSPARQSIDKRIPFETLDADQAISIQ